MVDGMLEFLVGDSCMDEGYQRGGGVWAKEGLLFDVDGLLVSFFDV
jgi:hypothetical protein